MALYLCILFQNGRVIDVKDIDAPDDSAAVAYATDAADRRQECLGCEVWHKGKRVDNYTKHLMRETG